MGQFYPRYQWTNCKKSKTSLTKIGHFAVSKSQWVGFSSTETDCDKFESREIFFSISLFGLFSPEPLCCVHHFFIFVKKNISVALIKQEVKIKSALSIPPHHVYDLWYA